MKRTPYVRRSQSGAGHVLVVVVCLVMVSIFAIGWTVAKRQPTAKDAAVERSDAVRTEDKKSATADTEIRWIDRDDGSWVPSGEPPECPKTILKQSPVNTSKATTVLLPGQYRGKHFKAHGGLRYDNNANNEVRVELPLDARVVGLKRYYQTGIKSGQQELQYLLTFENSCGIQIRFDHLATLSEEFSKIADTTAAPALDDTRSLPLQEQPSFKAGTLVATHIGAPDGSNTGLDFGVYDIRRPNEISNNSTWAALHRDESKQTFYGVCWLDWLPKSDANRLNKLMAQLPVSPKGTSDYCTAAPGGSTLQYNIGQPTE